MGHSVWHTLKPLRRYASKRQCSGSWPSARLNCDILNSPYCTDWVNISPSIPSLHVRPVFSNTHTSVRVSDHSERIPRQKIDHARRLSKPSSLPRAYSTLLLSLSSRHKIISQARIWLFDRYLSLPSPFSRALWKANWCKINPHWFSVIICPIDARRVSLSLCRRAF